MRAAATRARQFLATFFAPERRALRGDAPLWFVFWVYGVALSSLLSAITIGVFVTGNWPLLQILIFTDVGYSVWVLVAIWRCSAKVTMFWGALARWLTVAWALNTTFVLLFVEIELAARHASG